MIARSAAALLLLAGCASAPRLAVEPPPISPPVSERPVVVPQVPDGRYERPHEVQRPPTAPDTADSGSARAREILLHARRQLGVPYRYGGKSPDRGFDCSGFVRYVYKQVGIALPRTTEAMSEIGHPVKKSELEPGDLVFFDTRKKPFSHVGIYVDEQRFIHAPASGGVVQLVDMRERYWHSRYVGARRIAPTRTHQATLH